MTLAWSPDSRWLFAVAANGTLAIVNPRTPVYRKYWRKYAFGQRDSDPELAACESVKPSRG
jgi:hypothetical protein